MTWFLVFPLSLMAGPAGLFVAIACFLASRQKDNVHRGGTPSMDQMMWDECKRQPLNAQAAYIDKHF